MDYNFKEIEEKWQQRWVQRKTYHVNEDKSRPKYYVLNMFPYPSGAGLHVGHPLGYIASDIYARFKRQQGYNVLNPMGYDAYGLPAEQYAIQTGQHPAVTTEQNINRYRQQLDKMGFSFDWDREIRTCDPKYYHWTQWAFQKMFNSYYDTELQKAMPIDVLVKHFETDGTNGIHAAQTDDTIAFSAEEWNAMDETRQAKTLMNYRIAYRGEMMVNWCAGLGTVLANDEVVDGVSERGGFPVVQKKMSQWCLRVSAYAQRLLDGLNTVEWSDSITETQKNWIGRSEGAEVKFKIQKNEDGTAQETDTITIFTTRADTMFGVTFMVLAPESDYVKQVTTDSQRAEVERYLEYVKKRTEVDRMSDHKVTGVPTGANAINPLTGEAIPIYVSEYVLAGYGTGAIMAVPAHDSRDYAFAKHFGLPIIPLIEGADVSEESFDAKEGIVTNSPMKGKRSTDGFSLNGLTVSEAIAKTKQFVSDKGIGRVKVNYRIRDAIFSRQRYWGEPFPVYYDHGLPKMIPEECLPIELPEIKEYKPTEMGEPPLGRAERWAWDTKRKQVTLNSEIDERTVFPIDLYTMPGFAGSSAYYLRYMDPRNDKALVGKAAAQYWRQVDLYVGGTEHATGHLIYSRFWNKFLFDLGVSFEEEPYHKLVNQGMIQGRSNFVYRVEELSTVDKPVFVSYNLRGEYKEVTPIHVWVNLVKNDMLDMEAFKQWRPEYQNAEFICEDGNYVCGWAVEKMSKSMYNVVNPDDIIRDYGADTLRLYEMFLGPVEASKPWDTNGIDGCFRFLRKFWNLFFDNRTGECLVDNSAPSKDSLKSVHKLIKKVTADIETFSYNTSISAFMICVNELGQQKCHSKELLELLVTIIAPFTPYIAEELWEQLGHKNSVCDAEWPKWNEAFMVENEMQMTVSFNGKARFQMVFGVDDSKESIQEQVMKDERTQKYIAGKNIVKTIIVPKKIINIVLK